MNVIVIDDFYQNPDAVRDLALSAEYKDVTQLNYPGYQSIKAYSSDALTSKFADILGRRLDIDPAKHTFGKFRIMLKETGSRLKVHLDGFSDWTGVLYLNPEKSCEGGTAFYRHRATGLDGRVSIDKVNQLGFDSWNSLEKSIIEPDTMRMEAWEEQMYVAMKFNRLVLFKGNEMFHCHTHSFGLGKLDGRMTQNFFFNEA
ncbi:MAG TPA: DUF6445 family protein [Bdellovibrio sp.]